MRNPSPFHLRWENENYFKYCYKITCFHSHMLKKSGDLEKENYFSLSNGICQIVTESRNRCVRTINSTLTATYWEIGRRIVEYEQGGQDRAEYGSKLLKRLSADLTKKIGRGFSVDNLESMRLFYISFPNTESMEKGNGMEGCKGIGDFRKSETVSRKSSQHIRKGMFRLSWSHYVRIVRRCSMGTMREFYESEAIKNEWSVRELNRQINSRYFERTVLSKNHPAIVEMNSGGERNESDPINESIKDPVVLEFLDLKDEYSESDLEGALLLHLESFLLELGNDFTFITRQKRLRIGHDWFRVDLLFFHRKLRCLVLLELKIGKFTHSDVGQMHMYLNYAREHWAYADENPPVGIILCAEKDNAVAKYSLQGLDNRILPREYLVELPNEEKLIAELQNKLRAFENLPPDET